MTKIVYNACYGGFALSAEAVRLGKSLSSDPHWQAVNERYGYFEGPRHDPTLVQVVEQLGDEADGMGASLAVCEVPSGTCYRIDEYDGRESVVTMDQQEWIVAP